MNIFRKLHKNYLLNKYAKAYGFKRIKSIYKDNLSTKSEIESYFKEYWFVRDAEVIVDENKYSLK